MNIREFVDMKQLEEILNSWSKATGMAAVAVDENGEYVSGEIGFTDFCLKYTRSTEEGTKRCLRCDQEGKDVFQCHAGLMAFNKDIVVDGILFGRVSGGQILSGQPNEDRVRAIASEIGVDPDEYVDALSKIDIRSEENIRASADLLGTLVNQLVSYGYHKKEEDASSEKIASGIENVVSYIHNINSYTKNLDKLEKNQKILALNASIESARAGEAGKGFAIVANKVGSLAADFGSCTHQIKEELERLTEAMGEITGQGV